MPRPPIQGLAFYRKEVGFYGDYCTISLLADHGPVGVMIYEVLLDFIYGNGYYLEAPLKKVAVLVRQTIGMKWVPSVDLVLQVIRDCADLGLFDKDLVQQSVLTSTGIQECFSKATVRNKVDKSKYWLLGEERGAGGSMPGKSVSATETPTYTPISATETPTYTPISATETKQDKIRQDKIRCYSAKREKPRYGNFDTDEFFNRAVAKSLENIKKKQEAQDERASN